MNKKEKRIVRGYKCAERPYRKAMRRARKEKNNLSTLIEKAVIVYSEGNDFAMPKKTAADLDLKAPAGKFRVIGVDTFDGTDWIEDDYDSYLLAQSMALKKGGAMLKTHVYDDQGKHLFEAGTF